MERSEGKKNSNILWVKADPPNATPDERRKALRALSGAITHTLRNFGDVKLRCFGNACIGKAAKALARARGMIGVEGFDLYFTIGYIEAEMGGETKKGLCFFGFTSETDPKQLLDTK